MKLKTFSLLGAGFLALVMVVIILSGLLSSRNKDGDMIIGLFSHKLLDNSLDSSLVEATRLLSAEPGKQIKWLINKPPQTGWLNLLVINSTILEKDLSFTREFPQWASFKDNCLATAYRGSIVCDGQFLRHFLEAKGVDSVFSLYPNKEVADRLESEDFQSFLLWVIGHEAGHEAMGHVTAGFSEPSFEKIVSDASFFQKREYEADSFFVSLISPDSMLCDQVSRMAIDLMNQEIKAKVGSVPYGVGILFDYTNQKMVGYNTQGSHPEFVLRMVRMLRLTAKARKEEGLENELDEFVRNLRRSQ